MTDGEKVVVDNPSNMPDPQKIERVEEPYVKATMMVPNDYVGAVMELCQGKRGNVCSRSVRNQRTRSLLCLISADQKIHIRFPQEASHIPERRKNRRPFIYRASRLRVRTRKSNCGKAERAYSAPAL
jgi:hypothetical protein